ncbi:ATP-binding protein [Thermodesulfobacteriota bacterium]
MKFTILKRLMFGYIAIMLPVTFMGGYVTLKLNQLNRITSDIASVDVPTVRRIELMLNILLSQVQFEKKYLVLKDPDFYEQFNKTRRRFHETAGEIEPLLDIPKEKELFSGIKESYSRYLSLFEEEARFLKGGENYSHKLYNAERDRITNGIGRTLREIIMIERTDRDAKIALSNRVSYRVLRVSTATASFIIIVGVLISFLNTRSINRSIKLLKKKTREIAAGRFIEINDIISPPEIKELAEDFNIMSKKLQDLDEMKMDFMSHVSHELRTPLTAIREASGILRDGKITGFPEKQRELLNIINEECERLIEAVNKILDLSRMESGMMDYRFEKSSLIPLLQKAVLKLAPIAHNKKIDLELKPLQQLPEVNIDAGKIGYVLENLLDNALKYTPENGAVSITAASLLRDEPEQILVSVSDNGFGISRENRKIIFDKFKRIDRRGETVRGTGLGLSTSRHIINDHGGKIWVESQPGKGSTFSFTLPVS